MKNTFWIILLSVLAVLSCNKQESINPVHDNVKLSAGIAQEHTKVAFDESGNFFWTINDAIGVTTETNTTTFNKMGMEDGGAGQPTATFSAKRLSGTPAGYAVYPYNSNHGVDGSVLTYHFPASYDYTIEDTDFFVTDGTGNSFNPPMWAEIINDKVSFKHLGAVLCVKLSDMPAGDNQTLTVTTTNKITGNFTADLAADVPVLETTESDTENTVTINFSNSTVQTRVFYVPVPLGTYDNIVVSFMEDGELVEISFGKHEIYRRLLKVLTDWSGSIEGGEATQVSGVSGANNALANGKTSVSISNISSTESTYTLVIPEQESEESEVSVEIKSVEYDGVITIDEVDNAANSASALYLTVPEEAVANIVIDMPNTSVYVNGKIVKLTATTAANTLVVNEGTEISELIVKAGNVRLQKGGKIGSIVAETPVYLILEEGAVIPATVGANVTVVSGSEFELAQAIANAQPGETVTLTNDVEISSIIAVDKAITIDGNGKKLTSTAARAINVATEGNVTIKNLTIEASGERAINVITSPAVLAIDNVTATAANYTVNVAASAGAAKVNITNSDLTGLNVVNVAGQGSVISVTDTKITCDDQNEIESYTALCLNKDATSASITATGCTFDIKGDSEIAGSAAENGVITIDNTAAGTTNVAAIEYGDYYYAYPTLESAIEAAKAGQTIILTQDIEASEIIVVNKAITIDGNGKTLTSTAARAINVATEGNVAIKNLTIDASGERAINVITYPAVLAIDNVTATAANYTVNVATSAGAAQISITNSTLTGACTVNVSGAGCDVTIEGSTVNCVDNNTANGEAYAALSLNKEADGGSIIATNTTVNVTEGSDSYKARNSTMDGVVSINGSTDEVITIVAVITYEGNNYYHGFTSLADAVEFAKTGDTITLLCDITSEDQVTVNKNITIDLNGKTMTGVDKTSVNYGLIHNKGTLAIVNSAETEAKLFASATINSGWSRYSAVLSNEVGGNLTVGQNIVVEHLGGTDMAYGIDNLTNGRGTSAVLTLEGATVKSTYTAIRQFLNGVEAVNSVTVNAGTVIEGTKRGVWMHDSSKNANSGSLTVNEGANVNNVHLSVTDGSAEWPIELSVAASSLGQMGVTLGSYVPAGYEVVLVDGFYVIERATISTEAALVEAIANANSGSTVTLTDNITLSSTLVIPAEKSITLDLNGKTIEQSMECTDSYSMITNRGSLTITGNGVIKFEDLSNGGGDEWGSYILNNYGELVIENGTLEHLGTADDDHDTSIPIQNYAGKVTVNGGVISSPKFRSLRDFTAGGEIIINGGVFKGQVWMQGLGTGSSSLTITGGEFSPTAGYDRSSVYVTNGTNVIDLAISGGKFNTKIGCASPDKEGAAGCITGGVFTESAKTDTSSSLLASGYKYEANTDGTYTVVKE